MKARFSIAAALLYAGSTVAFAGGYKEVDVKDGATIKGVVSFAGKALPDKTVTKDNEACGKSTPDASISTKDGKLVGVVVYLKKVKAGKKWTPEQKKVVSDQKGCVFHPAVALIAEGGTVVFKNSDKVLHNVKSTSVKNPPFNEGVNGGGSIEKVFKKGHEAVSVTCSVHDWMSMWVVVMKNPYYAVTNDKGEYELKDVPAGKYKLVIMHGSLKKECDVTVGGKTAAQKKSGVKIAVKAGETLEINANYKG